MDTPRLRSCELRYWQESPEAQREEGNHALRCVPLPLVSNSLHPSALGLAARSAVARGQPLDPAEGHSPSDSLRVLGSSTCGNVFLWVRYSVR